MLPVTGRRFLLLWGAIPVIGILIYPWIKPLPDGPKWLATALSLAVMFFSILVHEISHGLAAFGGGDDTAKNAGRLTFNPLSHVSVFGSIILPLVLYLTHVPVLLGWAKPVPLNPMKLRRYPRDQIFSVLAGPLSNFALAYAGFTLFCCAATIFRASNPAAAIPVQFASSEPLSLTGVSLEPVWFVVFQVLNSCMAINVSLAIFNLIPFPPLDGFWLFKAVFPPKITAFLTRIQIFGFLLIILLLQTKVFAYLLYPIVMLVIAFMGVVNAFFA